MPLRPRAARSAPDPDRPPARQWPFRTASEPSCFRIPRDPTSSRRGRAAQPAVILDCPDYEDFRDGRGFSFDPLTMMPGVLTRTTSELYDEPARFNEIAVSPKTAELVDFYWGDNAGGGACARIASFIKGHRATRT